MPTSQDPILSRSEAPRRWPSKLLRLAGTASFVLGVIVTHGWISPRLSPARNTASEQRGLVLTRQPGAQAAASRCSDCQQPGDVVTARAAAGSTLHVYHRDELWLSCQECSALAFTIPEPGQFEVVSVEVPRGSGCVINARGSLDVELLRLRECGARLETAKIVVRP